MRVRCILLILILFTLNACSGIPITVNGEKRMLFGPKASDRVKNAERSGSPVVTLPADLESGVYKATGAVVRIDRYDMANDPSPIPTCGNDRVALQPSLIIEITDNTPTDMEAYLNGLDGTIVSDSGDVFCTKDDPNLASFDWAPGVYALYPSSSSHGEGSMSLSLAIPSQLAEQALSLFPSQPVRIIKTENPSYLGLDAGELAPSIAARHVGLSECGKKRLERLRPVTMLEISSASTYKIQLGNQSKFVLVGSDGTCLAGSDNGSLEEELKPDTYQVWSRVRKEDVLEQVLIVEDSERALQFEDARSMTTLPDDALRIVTASVASKPEPRMFCGQGRRTPLATFENTSSKQQELRLFYGEKVDFVVIDPASQKREYKCGNSFVQVRQGHVAHVFAREQDDGARIVLAAGEYDHEKLLDASDTPESNPSIEDREVGRYYGMFTYAFLRKSRPMIGNVEALFVNVPAEIFVFANEAREGLLVGEPLLLIEHDEERSRVLRMNGTIVEVRTSTLSTTLDGEAQMPELGKLEKLEKAPQVKREFNQNISRIGVLEMGAAMAITARYAEFWECVETWRKENDPTWFPPGYTMVKTKRSVAARKENIAKAKKICKESKVDEFAAKSFQAMYDSQLSTRKALESRIAKGF